MPADSPHLTLPAFDPQRLDALLRQDPRPWAAVRYFPQCGSTQAELRRDFAQQPGPTDAWRVAVADLQTEGRGRARIHHPQGYRWQSPDRTGLLLTAGTHLLLPPAVWPRASLVAGLAVAEALARLDLPVWVKWPNDLMIRTADRWSKVGGILCERVGGPCDAPLWLCGIGLNVHPWQIADLDESRQGLNRVASPLSAVGPVPPREELAAAVLRSLRDEVEAWRRGGGRLDLLRLERRLAFRGGDVELDLGPLQGQAWARLDGLEETGALRVRRLQADGTPGDLEIAQPLSLCAAKGPPAWQAPDRPDLATDRRESA